MKNFFTKIRLGFIASIMLLTASTFAQTKISGKVSDGASKESLIGVSIGVKGKVIGTISDTKGNFALSTTTPTPFTISVSSVGYKTQEIVVSGSKTDFDIKMEEQNILGQEVVVSASRVEESVMKSPVSVEKMDLRALQTSPSASFYDALKNLKGVDVNTQSLTFSSVTTRGFNGNGNPRVVQLVDGMDNQAPGLNFAVGNIVGISELDLESVELIPGAASALYGPNAMNGIVLMNSKSPFLFQGLSANVKFGTMSENNRTTPSTGYTDYAFRYAKAFNNKFAFKVNFAYLQAQDWQASNYNNQSLRNGFGPNQGTRATDQAYDGINVYGDESTQGLNFQAVLRPILQDPTNGLTAGINQISAATGGFITPTAIFNTVFPSNTVFVSRTGYEENTIADYTTKSLKLNGALHYRINDKIEAVIQGNYGFGTSLYTGSDRYSIKNFTLWQGKAELKGSDFYLRAYTTQENSGDSYANSLLAQGINEAWKKSETWYGDYVGGFAGTYGVAALTAYSTAFQTAVGNALRAGQTQVQAITAGVTAATTAVAGISPSAYYGAARANADKGRFLPGTPEFNAAAEESKNRAIPGILSPASARKIGSKFQDRTAMYHLEGMYNLTKTFNDALEVIVGANYRNYALNSSGTIFALDADGKEFSITEFGGYVSLGKKMFDDKFKLSGSMRYDKNENFAGQFTPRIAGVFSPSENSNFRVSYQTGFRMPTTQNQYIDLFVGSSRLLGGLPFLREKYFQGKQPYNLVSVASGAANPQAATFGEYKPEKVGTWEVGYKGLLGKKLFVDAYYYSSIYTDFINGQVVTTASKAADINALNVFSISSNSSVDVKTAGWGLGFDYSLPGGFNLGLNGARNEVTNQKDLPIESQQTGYSTPLYRVNASVSNRNIAGSGFGFGVTWRYQEAFDGPSGIASTLVSAQRLGYVPQFNTLDIQVSKKLSSIKSILKIGGNNVMGNGYYTGYGNPTVGSTFYVGLTFDELLNK